MTDAGTSPSNCRLGKEPLSGLVKDVFSLSVICILDIAVMWLKILSRGKANIIIIIIIMATIELQVVLAVKSNNPFMITMHLSVKSL